MHQEEKDQKEIQIGVHIYGIFQRKQYSVPPGISRDQEDDHEDKKYPGADAVYLDEKSATIQSKFT
jgi:hypothetical protein